MPRSHRITHKNAFFHVMNRGRNRENIFHNEKDFKTFLKFINQTHKKFKFAIHAFCLMSNHYHLLLEDCEGNLSKIMHDINRKYVEFYNQTKGCDGSLFKGRFKSILIDQDEYLVELTRYIHRNPIKLVKKLEDYKWSSYKYYLGLEPKLIACLEKNKTLTMFGCKEYVSNYEIFVNCNREKENLFQNRKNLPTVLGSSQFKKKIFSSEK